MNKYIGENRLTYLWGKIKAFVSNAISGKVDKVSSSTDNAIVRFDGTSGGIQNSGVTINDSNHLTAAKLITSGGTSSQFVKGDGSLDNNTYAGAQTSGGAANKAVSIPFGQVDSTSTSTAFTATVDGITELRDGVCVYLRNGVVTSAANCTLNVNGLGAKPMYTTMNATTAVATHWNVSYTMLFIYNSTRVSGGCWDMYWGYYTYSNTIGYQLRRNNSVLPASDTSRYYKIFFTSADNTKWVPASADSTNNATSARAVNQRPINPFGPIEYLSTTTTYTAGTNIPASSLWQQYNVTLGYSFNRTGAALTLTTGKPVFIKCAPQDDGSAIIDANTPYVQDLPTTEDGKIYIFLGVAYSATQIELQMVHPVYYYKNGAINLWTGIGTQTDVSKSTESNIIDIGGYDLMKINEVKGKSLVMNQRAKNPNPSITNNTEWRAYDNSNVSIEYVDDGVKATILNEGYGYSRGIAVNCTGIANTHKYLAIITIKPSVTHDFNFEIGNRQAAVSSCTANQWTKFAAIVTSSMNNTQLLIVKPAISNLSVLSVNETFTVRFASCIDLTQMFGAGNEPTTVEEVEAILGNEYYEYNTGEVVGNSVEKLDVYDSNDTKKGSLALNLTELTGKVNGEGTSVTIFPDGLHGVGTAFDSLIVDEDGYARRAVKRMGSRAYASGDESDTSVITDNTNTFYPLATPIEYVLDTPVQCVTKVYPNGTVKQVPVMPDSTPMVMDVTYLHDNGGMIGGLMNRLASLEPRIDDFAKGIKTISVLYGDATNIVLETEKINGNEGTVSIPAATSQAAGAMSAAQAALLEDLSDLADDIETLLASI